VDPSPPAPPAGWIARRARQRAQVRGASLYEQISRDPRLRPLWDRNRVATVVAAIAVHLSSAVVALGGCSGGGDVAKPDRAARCNRSCGHDLDGSTPIRAVGEIGEADAAS
jgi:hypothetical protein